MAVKTTSRKTEHNFDVGTRDDVLGEVLAARKTNLTLNGSSIIPNDHVLIEDEPLTVEDEEIDDKLEVVSFEAVRARSTQVAMANEDPQMKREQKKKARKLTGRRFFETLAAVGLVILVGVFFMLLLYPQTEISELARDNSNLKDQINTAKREIVTAEENANGITDMDVIRAQAIALGMQDPNQNQVINLQSQSTDTLRTNVNYSGDGISDEAFDDSQEALAAYYEANPDK